MRYDVIGHVDEQWVRIVMNRATFALVTKLQPERLDVLEVSGLRWERLVAFKSYRSESYPTYDVCAGPLPDRFDLVIAEQVFEHRLYPYRAGRNVYDMLRPGGCFLVTTPFLIRLHDYPTDCSRWSEMGLRHFLEECGFPLDRIQTWSWGNRACVKGNLDEWKYFNRRLHSLENEPDVPIAVWALAEK